MNKAANADRKKEVKMTSCESTIELEDFAEIVRQGSIYQALEFHALSQADKERCWRFFRALREIPDEPFRPNRIEERIYRMAGTRDSQACSKLLLQADFVEPVPGPGGKGIFFNKTEFARLPDPALAAEVVMRSSRLVDYFETFMKKRGSSACCCPHKQETSSVPAQKAKVLMFSGKRPIS